MFLLNSSATFSGIASAIFLLILTLTTGTISGYLVIFVGVIGLVLGIIGVIKRERGRWKKIGLWEI